MRAKAVRPPYKLDMSVIGPSKGTSQEVMVAKFLRGCGLRVRLNHKALPGSPDCYLPDLRIAVFCDGRFWHDPAFAKTKRRRHHKTDFYLKAMRNRQRDRRNDRDLQGLSVSVVRIWDSSLHPRKKIKTFFKLLNAVDRLANKGTCRIRL